MWRSRSSGMPGVIDLRASRTESLTHMAVILKMRISRICSTSPTVSSLFVFMSVHIAGTRRTISMTLLRISDVDEHRYARWFPVGTPDNADSYAPTRNRVTPALLHPAPHPKGKETTIRWEQDGEERASPIQPPGWDYQRLICLPRALTSTQPAPATAMTAMRPSAASAFTPVCASLPPFVACDATPSF